MLYSLPPRRTQSRGASTARSPPTRHAVQTARELVGLVGELAARCRRVRISSTPLTFSSGDVHGHAAAGVERPRPSRPLKASRDAVAVAGERPRRRCCPPPVHEVDWAGWCRVHAPGRARTGSSPLRTSCLERYRSGSSVAVPRARVGWKGARILAARGWRRTTRSSRATGLAPQGVASCRVLPRRQAQSRQPAGRREPIHGARARRPCARRPPSASLRLTVGHAAAVPVVALGQVPQMRRAQAAGSGSMACDTPRDPCRSKLPRRPSPRDHRRRQLGSSCRWDYCWTAMARGA